MKTIQDILKNTYQITFKREVTYQWTEIAIILMEQSQPYGVLKEKHLLINEESKEKVLYWQDLFFMEIVERRSEIDTTLIEKIKDLELYKANFKFLNTLTKATLPVGREFLIDELINVSDDKSTIPDHIIEMAVKKKSREDLREKFKEWGDEMLEPSKNDKVDNEKTNKSSIFQYFKYLVAASVVGIIAVIGFNKFNNGSDFNDSQFVQISNVKVKRNIGIGFAGEESESSILIQIFDFNEAIASKKGVSSNLVLNSYQFHDKELKLVLKDSNQKMEVLALKKGSFYLKLDKKFYNIETSTKFKNLVELTDQNIMEQLKRILFENE